MFWKEQTEALLSYKTRSKLDLACDTDLRVPIPKAGLLSLKTGNMFPTLHFTGLPLSDEEPDISASVGALILADSG